MGNPRRHHQRLTGVNQVFLSSYDEAGNPKTKNVLAKTKKECIEKLEALKNSCQVVRPVQVRSDMLFRDWLDYWYQNYSKPRLRPSTQLNYES